MVLVNWRCYADMEGRGLKQIKVADGLKPDCELSCEARAFKTLDGAGDRTFGASRAGEHGLYQALIVSFV